MAKLLMAFRKQGASEGKPFFGTQALGIPWFAGVFILLRVGLLLGRYAEPTNAGFEASLLDGFGRLHFLDFLLLSGCIWMYTVDFFYDVLRWDALGFPMRSWQVIWFLFWGLLPFLGLLWVVPFIITVNFADIAWQVRWVIGGGVGYIVVQRMGGKMAAFLGPFFIAITFALALFWDVSEPWLNPLWRQGVLVFLLNVWVMHWFEQDKDGVSTSTNVWRFADHRVLWVLLGLLGLMLLVSWGGQAQRSWGLPALLLFYLTILIFPTAVRPFRLYRLLIDGALLLWLL